MSSQQEQFPLEPEDSESNAEGIAREPIEPQSWPAEILNSDPEQDPTSALESEAPDESKVSEPRALIPATEPPIYESESPALFKSWSQPEVVYPARIPHFGHLCFLAVLAFVGLIGTALVTRSALHFHLFGISNLNQAITDIHYTLGSMAALYLITLITCLIVFPFLWHESFFTGLQWHSATALRLRKQLFGAASVCFVLALLNGWLLPGPADTPIDKLFRTPMSAWLLFGFGITFAPLFEEIAFRGFLLPALCTAFDWGTEQIRNEPPPPLDFNGHPQWSIPAMVIGSILTSIPFAWMHAEQTGYSLGPFLLLICVSLVLCWIRLSTRSLASSVLVHACYNLLLFSLMMLGTGGFRHLDKM